VLTLEGLMLVNPTRENRVTEFGHCSGSYDYLFMEGAGTLRLNAHPDNLDSARIGSFCQSSTLRIAPGQTIAGTGRIQSVADYGLIEADIPGGVLEIASNTWPPQVNHSLIRARDGGCLRVRWLSQEDEGQVVVADAISCAEWDYASVS